MAPARVIGVDLGGTKALAGVVWPQAQVEAVARREVRRLPREEVLEAISGLVAELGGADAVGVGLPAVLRDGVVVRCVHHPLEGLDARALLRERLGVPVAVGNDANLALLAEAYAGAVVHAHRAVLLTIGTGIGGAIATDGVPDAVAELGHMVVDLDGPLCTCGSRGCLEALVSGPALAEAHGGGIDGTEVTRLALSGDPAALAAVDTIARRLGAGIASIVNALDPDVVVLGGGVMGLGELLLGTAREEARSRALVPERVHVVAAELGEQAGMIGAAVVGRTALP